MRLRALFLALILMCAFVCSFCIQAALPQESSDWEVGRVYVPVENQQLYIKDCVIMQLADFDRQLEQLNKDKRLRQVNPTTIETAFYMASLSRDLLVSDASFWNFGGAASTSTASVGSVSIALRDAKGIPEDCRQLSSDQRFNTDGSIDVDLSAEQKQLWFGFQAVASPQENSRRFDIQLPRAAMAQMLISTDLGIRIASSEVVITPVANPADCLPADWPTSLIPRPSPRQSWWRVYLAGAAEFSIDVSESTEGLQLSNAHAISVAEVTHQVNADSLDCAASFRLATESNGQPIALSLDKSLRVRSISVDGRPVAWRVIDSSADLALVQISSTKIDIGSVIAVQAVARLMEANSNEESDGTGDDTRYSIPTIAIANATVISGTTTIRGDQSRTIAQVLSDQEYRKSTLDPTLNASSLNWLSQWSGKESPSQIKLLSIGEQWSSSPFCRMNIQDSSILAQLTISLNGTGLRSNQIRLPVLPGWSIDSISIPKDSTNRLKAYLVSETGRDELLITWEGLPSLIAIQLNVIASSPIDGLSPTFSIRNPRVIETPDPNCPALWVLSSSSKYRLRRTVDLLPIVVGKSELANWQRQLVPEENLPIYRDLSDANGRFEFDAAVGWLTANMVTMVEQVAMDRLRLISQINCQPNSSALDIVMVDLPEGQRAEDWNFSFSMGDETAIPIQSVSEEPASGRIELRLPVSAKNPFTIRGSKELRLSENVVEGLELLVPGLPTGSNVESIVVIPSQLAHFEDQAAIELLPSMSSCSKEILEILDELSSNKGSVSVTQENFVGARVDGSKAHRFRINSASANQRLSWIWSESLVHEQTESGYCRHTLAIDVQTGSDNAITMTLPKDWLPRLITVDDAERQDYFWQVGELRIDLPSNSRSRLTIQFNSTQASLKWFTSLPASAPIYDLPVLQRSEKLELPLSYMALAWPTSQGRTLISQRLNPAKWWQYFSPGSKYSGLDTTLETDRPTYSLTSGQSLRLKTIWIVNRDSLSTLLLATLLTCAALNWLLINKSVRAWWLLNLSVLVLIVIVPDSFSVLGQVLLLSGLLGGLIRLIGVVTKRPVSVSRQTPASSPRITASLVLIAMFSSSAWAQVTDGEEKEKATKIYAVVIPYEGSSDAPKGEYAWIPKELRDLLKSAGNVVANKAATPKILSANYVMKLRQNQRDSSPIQELTAELKILATDTTSEILLPFASSQLQLNSSQLNGQTRLQGIRFEVGEDGIVFRPESVGLMTVALSFQPIVQESAEQKHQYGFRLPPVPNATLRIVPSSQTSSVNVNARGGTQRMPSGDYLSLLGAIDELQVEWAENDRSSLTIATEYTTETWVRSQADGLVVASQLTIERGRSLQEEFDLFIDADWEPVGTKWGDAELVSSTVSTAIKRRMVRIRLAESAGVVSRIRMLLSHKPNARSTSLDVPFVSIERVASKGKVFWWSPDTKSTWSPEGLDALPAKTDTLEWDDLKIASDRKGYQVFGRGVRLQQQSSANSNGTLSEQTALHVFASQTELDYEASWERSASIYEDVVVNIPSGSELKRLEVNGKLSTAVGRQAGSLRIPITGSTSAKIKLVLELPPLPKNVQELPRVQIKNLQARQSGYQIYRGTGLDVQLLPADSGLVFTNSMAASKRTILDKLETLVGEAILPVELLSESSLPAQLEIKPRAATPHRSLVQYLVRKGNSWKAIVRCTWDAQTSALDYALFDVPLALRDEIEIGNQVCIFKPHDDPSRTNLCIPIPLSENGEPRSVEFSYPVTAMAAAQTLNLPLISANHGVSSSPVVALPRIIDGVEVNWPNAGRSVDPEWFDASAVNRSSEFDYLLLSPNHSKIVWQSSESSSRNTFVEMMWLDVTSSSSDKMAGIVNYWIAPKGQATQRFQVPNGCEILGVDCGTRRTTWSVDGQELQVTLQPNSVPLSVRIMAQWRLDSNSSNSTVQIPMPIHAVAPTEFFLSTSDDTTRSVINRGTVTSVGGHAVVAHWAALVLETADSLGGMSERQVSNWLAAWDPNNFRIRTDTLVDLAAKQAQLATFDGNDDGDVSVGELWERAVLLARSPDYSTIQSSRSVVPSDFNAIKWRIQGSEVQFSQRVSLVGYDTQRWLVALGLGLLGFACMFLAPKLKTRLMNLFASQPWLYWTVLAVVIWVALPISWPGIFVLAVSLWLGFSQWIENRRRSRRFGFY